jgi:diguanylate cyclase (GGDEF)-like protein
MVLLSIAAITVVEASATSAPDWRSISIVDIALATALVLSVLVPWGRLVRPSTLVFPAAVWLSVVWLAHLVGGVGAEYVVVFALTFVYIGLTQPPGVATAFAPMAALLYADAENFSSWRLVAPVVLAAIVWVLIAESLASVHQRQRDLAVRLELAAHTDVLTGLANRRDLDLRLATAAAGDLILVCDLDQFALVNDTLGLAGGDQVLADFGMLLISSLRAVDYAARTGGEEFALLLPRTEQGLAPVILARLRHRWSVLHPDVTFSSGAATFLPGRTPSQTLTAADTAMRKAKEGGRNRDYADSGLIGLVSPNVTDLSKARTSSGATTRR